MFPRHYVAFCQKCGESTPHEDHRFGRGLSIAFGLVGITLAFLAAFFSIEFLVAGVCALISIIFLASKGMWFSFDRHEKHVNERCTRCRHRRLVTWRATQPNPRNTTIDPFCAGAVGCVVGLEIPPA